MSLGVCIKSPEGLVLAAESRVTLQQQTDPKQPPVYVTYDNATKLLSFHKPHDAIGVVSWGTAAIGLRTAQSYVPELEAALPKEEGEDGELLPKRLTVEEFANHLSGFFKDRFDEWQATQKQPFTAPPMIFVTGGYDDGAPYGSLFEFQIPHAPNPVAKNPGAQFGMTWGGQREITDRLVQGFDGKLIPMLAAKFKLDAKAQAQLAAEMMAVGQLPMPLQAMPLQDCVDLAFLFIATTIETQRLTVGLRGCGGPIDLAIITRSGLEFVQRKRIHGQAEPTEGR